MKRLTENILRPKNLRLIYVIENKLPREELEKIITECDIDYFSIDTQCFDNVKDYFGMIDIIKTTTERLNINIGIIAELAGRKIKVESINLRDQKVCRNYELKKGQQITIYSNENKKISKNENENSIRVSFKDLHKLVKVNDSIIINDNKGEFKVLAIKQSMSKSNSTNLLENGNLECGKKHRRHDSWKEEQKINLVKLSSNFVLVEEEMANDNAISPEDIIMTENSVRHDSFPVLSSNKSKETVLSETPSSSNISDKEEYAEIYKDYDMNFISDETEKEDYRNERTSSLFKQVARKHTIHINTAESPLRLSLNLVSYHDKINLSPVPFSSPLLSPERVKTKRQQLYNNVLRLTKSYEIICEVAYDCSISQNSVLFVPNVDYSSLGIDVLSKREVAEINHLDEKAVDFICIGIKSPKDIESIREVNSNINIIASLPDYSSLEYFEEIIDNCSGILLSRTFQILNDKTRNSITRLTKNVVMRCKTLGKPVFSFIDVSSEFLLCRRRRKSHTAEVMNNITNGMDGFFLSVKKEDRNINIPAIDYFVDYFKNIHEDQLILYSEEDDNKPMMSSSTLPSPFEVQASLIQKYDSLLKNCFIAYSGDSEVDVQSITRFKLKSPLLVFSNDSVFLNKMKLFYSVMTLKLEQSIEDNYNKKVQFIQDFLIKNFPRFNVILVISDDKFDNKLVKILSL